MYLICVAMDYLRCRMPYVVYQQDVIDVSSVEGNVLCMWYLFQVCVGTFLQQYLKWEIP